MTSGDLSPVEDNAGHGHSPFCNRVLQYLKSADPVFSASQLYTYIEQNTTAQEEPLFAYFPTSAHMPGGEFVFVRETTDQAFLNRLKQQTTDSHIPTPSETGQFTSALSPSPMPEYSPPDYDFLSFKISNPANGSLFIENKKYPIGEQTIIDLPEGQYRFIINVPGEKTPIFGILEVFTIAEQLIGTLYGGSSQNHIFKDTHIKAALSGRPVRYEMSYYDSNQKRAVAARYRLSLRQAF
jgi:hypothetical protein